jgi:hypothetical protein
VAVAVFVSLYIFTAQSRMKKFFPLLFLFLILLFAAGCKKCFKCYNECVLCSKTVNSHTFLDTLCNDSYNNLPEFETAITFDTATGYVCNEMPSTYSYDFCVNKPGEEDYPNYFNKGKKVKCDEK